jgi:DNA-binding transcriptional LysR family regulator
VENRSFTKAAAKLGLSQPAVSGHIKRLQEQLGADLFDKSAPGIRLSEQGHTALKYARDILATQQVMFRQIAEHVNGNGILRVGLPFEMRCMKVIPALAEFRNDHPDITLALYRDVTSQLKDDFNRGDIDLFISVATEEEEGSAWSYCEPMAWVAARDKIDLRTDPLDVVMHPDGCVCTEMMKSALADAGIPYRQVLMAQHPEAKVAALNAHMGVGALTFAYAKINTQLRVVDTLPGLPDICWNAFIHQGARATLLEQLAACLLPAFVAQNGDASV